MTPFQERDAEGEKRRFDLVWVQVHAGVEHGPRQTIHAARPVEPGQFVGKLPGVVGGRHAGVDSWFGRWALPSDCKHPTIYGVSEQAGPSA